MAGTANTETRFGRWLGGEIERQGLKRRALARRLAAQHPDGVQPHTVETYRRAIYKYLDAASPTVPTVQTKQAFAEALGVDPSEIPSDDEEDDLAATLQALVREQSELSRRLAKALKAVQA